MRKPVLILQSQALIAVLACAVTLPVTPLIAGSGEPYYGNSMVEIEIVKRQRRVQEALDAEREGDRLYAKQDNAGAIERYQFALNTMPNGLSNQNDRNRIIQKFARAAVTHARELGHRGEFAKAKTLLNTVLSDSMDPNYKDAQTLLKQLDDPDRFNQAQTPKHYADTEEVKRLFNKGLGFYDLGQFKEAEDEFNRILAIDPTNTAARRQLERSQREITGYLKAARDETRLRMLNAVDNLWVTVVPGTAKVPVIGPIGNDDPGSAPISFKLNNITIERLQFSEADIDEVVNYLRKKSQEADTMESDPNKKGVNFLNRVPAGGTKSVSLDMRNVKLLDAVKAATEQAGVRFDVQPNSVVIVPAGQGGSMTTRTFRVPPDFLTRGGGGGGGDAAAGDTAAADPFATAPADGAAAGPRLKGKSNAKEVLASLGVGFGEGAFASFDASSGRLVVRNTYDQLDVVETLVEGMINITVKQVYITTKFVEVTQRNTDELGFDWLMGAFNIGGERVFGSGGTSGSAGPISSGDYSVITPGGTPVGSNPLTRGLRFGADAISRNAIDSLIAGGTAAGVSAVTPATFAIAGVFTDPQFQVMMRALSQKKGVDLMTAPSIIVRGGQRSKIEVIREFPYPTEFDPPQIPQTFGGGGVLNGGGLGQAQQGSSFPVTPTTPNSFTFRNTGVTMEVEATVGEDGYTIDLNLAPEVVEFEGFINYGSPIQTTGVNALGQSEPVVLTDNKILQPVFATRKLSTQVLIWDRQTVGIGGLIREDVQHVEDRVPIFSSIPLIGRLFKTKNEEHFKKNLMIYVTGQLVDPAGAPIHGNEQPALEPVSTEGSLFPTPPPSDGIPVMNSGK